MSEPFDPYYQWLGIPPEEQPPNHYQLVGIRWFEDNVDVISAAVDRQMLHLRTYQIGEYSDVSQRLLGEVISAKLCLLDPKRKVAYDQWLLEGDLKESIETQKTSGDPAFGPQLEALFDESEQAEPGKLLLLRKKSRWKPSRRLVTLLIALGGGLLLVFALVLAAGWLVDSVVARLGDGSEPAPAVPPSPRTTPSQDDLDTNDGSVDNKPSAAKTPDTTGTPVAEPTNGDAGESKPKQPDKNGQPVKKPDVEPDASGTKSPSASKGENSESQAGAGLAAGRRLPIPTRDERQKAREQLEKQFHFSENRAAIGKIRLAKQLLRSERGLGIGPDAAAVRYEALERASKLAAEGGNYALSLAAIDEIGSRFEIDTLAAKQARLIEAVTTAKGHAGLQQLSIAAGRLVDEAADQNRFDVALRIIEITLHASQRPGGKEFRATFVERRKNIRKRQQRHEEIEAAQNTLETSPHDGPANLLLGKYYCFDAGDWQRGLPLLAAGSDEGLARVAKRELADAKLESTSRTVNDEVELADAWWKLATTTLGPPKKPILLRAAYWYQRAQPELATGRQTRHVAKRLETIFRLTEPKDTAR